MSETQAKKAMKRIELKFQIAKSLAGEVKAWARENLDADPYCEAKSNDTYEISTLYLDTAQLDLFHSSGKVGRTKHRIRRYGQEAKLWLETKRKKNLIVKKRRQSIWESDYRLEGAELPISGEVGSWFASRVATRALVPSIQVFYRRFARVSVDNGQAMRLTIDSQMKSAPVSGWQVPRWAMTKDQLEIGEQSILELKFNNRLPHRFKELLRQFPISMTGFSKYRQAVEIQNFSECQVMETAVV